MRKIIVTRTQVWEETIPDVGLEVEVEEIVGMVLDTEPDYEDVEVEER